MKKIVRMQAKKVEDFQMIASRILREFPLTTYRLWLLRGPLGAGKTTLVRFLAKRLGVSRRVLSPTFVIVSSYKGTRVTLHHMDLYRIRSHKELGPLGIYDLLNDAQSVSAIEWPNKFMRLFTKIPYVNISLVHTKAGRTITVSGNTKPVLPKRRARGFSKPHHQQRFSRALRK